MNPRRYPPFNNPAYKYNNRRKYSDDNIDNYSDWEAKRSKNHNYNRSWRNSKVDQIIPNNTLLIIF